MALFVYVAGPYSKGDVCMNVRKAIEAADALLALGYCPYVPHLTHLWHMISPHKYSDWLDIDKKWLSKCDILLRLPGDSSGADEEVDFATHVLRIPVVYKISDIKK